MDAGNWNTLRADELWPRASSDGFTFESNTTSAWDNEVKFAAAESVRTTILVLACFNTIAGFSTAAAICVQSWRRAKMIDAKWNMKSSWSNLIGPPDLFPFVLSCGITVQGIVFSVSQSKGLQALMILGCTRISQFMFPAFFITPIIQATFGLESAVRALKRRPFPSRGKWNTLICLAAIGISLLVMFIVTFAVQPPNFCFSCLVWYLSRYKLVCFALLVVFVVILATEIGVVSFRLVKATNLGPLERLESSQMVYFLIIAAISNALLIPYFIGMSFGDPESDSTVNSSMVASVVANLSGLLTGGLCLFLRSSRTATIGPNDWDGIEPKAFEKGFTDEGSSNFDFGLQIAQPLSAHSSQRQRSNNGEAEIPDSPEMPRDLQGSPGRSLHVPSLGMICPPINIPIVPKPARMSMKPTLKSLKPNWYNKMPVPLETPLLPKSSFVLPTSTYAPPPPNDYDVAIGSTDNLLAPPTVHEHLGTHRERGSSMLSSATVQIGLRLSNLGDIPPPTATFPNDSDKVHDIDCPAPIPLPAKKPSPLGITVITLPDEEAIHEQEQRNKGLTPVPYPMTDKEDRDDVMTLSPEVYSPPDTRFQHSRNGSRSSHRSKPSLSSRAPHSRHGSRAGPEVIREDWI